MSSASLRHFHGRDDLPDYLVGGKPFKISFRLKQNAVPQYGKRGSLYVVRQQIVAALHPRQGARDKEKTHSGARTRSQRNGRPVARPANQRNHVGMKRRFNANTLDFLSRRRK